MSTELSYINKIYNKDKNKVISYRVYIRPPRNTEFNKLVNKTFPKSKFKDPLLSAIEYRDTDEYCQQLINYYTGQKIKLWTIEEIKKYNISELKDNIDNIQKFDFSDNLRNILDRPFPHFNGEDLIIGRYNTENNITKWYSIFGKCNYCDNIVLRISKIGRMICNNHPNLKTINKGNKKLLVGEKEYFDIRCEKILNQFDIKEFPKILKRNVKVIGLDTIDDKIVFIKECRNCLEHSDILIDKINRTNKFCKKCLNNHKNSYFKLNTYKDTIYMYLEIRGMGLNNERKVIIKLLSKISRSEEKKLTLYEMYFKFLIDEIIIKYDLKYKRNFTDIELNEIKIKLISQNLKKPEIRINEELLIRNSKKIHHIFKAKILGFGNNKDNGNKTILFEAVEYVGIDNFRDHMWTEFRKDLDLPVGTTIKFKGEIYDYERNYFGKKEEDKNGQSIKIIDLLEVDTSTRKRVKLYE